MLPSNTTADCVEKREVIGSDLKGSHEVDISSVSIRLCDVSCLGVVDSTHNVNNAKSHDGGLGLALKVDDHLVVTTLPR